MQYRNVKLFSRMDIFLHIYERENKYLIILSNYITLLYSVHCCVPNTL